MFRIHICISRIAAFPTLEPATGIIPHRTPPLLLRCTIFLDRTCTKHLFLIFPGRLPPSLLRLAPPHTATTTRQDFYRKSVFETKYLFTVNDMDLHLMVRDNNTVGAFFGHHVASHDQNKIRPLLFLHRSPCAASHQWAPSMLPLAIDRWPA